MGIFLEGKINFSVAPHILFGLVIEEQGSKLDESKSWKDGNPSSYTIKKQTEHMVRPSKKK